MQETENMSRQAETREQTRKGQKVKTNIRNKKADKKPTKFNPSKPCTNAGTANQRQPDKNNFQAAVPRNQSKNRTKCDWLTSNTDRGMIEIKYKYCQRIGNLSKYGNTLAVPTRTIRYNKKQQITTKSSTRRSTPNKELRLFLKPLPCKRQRQANLTHTCGYSKVKTTTE